MPDTAPPPPPDSSGFSGFHPDALQFLADLAENNTREWFQPRKEQYESLIREPMEALCVALAEHFAALDLPLRADPKRSLFRIYRDVRFAKDKSPYKTSQGARFPWIDSEDDLKRPEGAVAGYFHLEPGNIFVGGGMWHPERARLAAFREAVNRDPNETLKALEDQRFRLVFGSVSGERLIRNPRGFPQDHPYSYLLRLKDVTFSRRLSDDEVLSAKLPGTIAHDLDAARPVLRFLDDLAEAPGHMD